MPPLKRLAYQEYGNPVKDAATDLRPISLTPVMSKIGESFIYKWLLESIEGRIDPY